MTNLLSILTYLSSHDRELSDLCDDPLRVMTQEEPILDRHVDRFNCPVGVDNEGHKTYPFGKIGLLVWAISLAPLDVPF
jgi:hypothetical protein